MQRRASLWAPRPSHQSDQYGHRNMRKIRSARSGPVGKSGVAPVQVGSLEDLSRQTKMRDMQFKRALATNNDLRGFSPSRTRPSPVACASTSVLPVPRPANGLLTSPQSWRQAPLHSGRCQMTTQPSRAYIAWVRRSRFLFLLCPCTVRIQPEVHQCV